MNQNEDQPLISYTIPDNILQSKRYFGFRRRNIIEAVISILIVGFVIYIIPFVTRVKIIFLVILCASVGILNLVGIKDLSLSELFLNLIISQHNRGIYHLRSIKYESRKQRDIKSESEFLTGYGESAADKTFSKAKELARRIKYGDS